MFKKLGLLPLAVLSLMSSAGAFAAAGDDAFTQMLGAVNLAGIATGVIAAGLVIVGIAIAFKSPDVAKRVVKKV